MKKNLFLIFSLILCLAFTSCSNSKETDASKSTTKSSTTKTTSASKTTEATEPVVVEEVDYVMQETPSFLPITIDEPENNTKETTNSFEMITTDGKSVCADNTYTITQDGTYTLSGKLEGNIIVSAKKCDVTLVLNNVTISSGLAAPIAVLKGSNVTIEVAENTYNILQDKRETFVEDESETETEEEEVTSENAPGALFADCDLDITGTGVLIVNGNYKNAIHCKDDLKIQDVTLKATGANHAVKGNDSITVEGATALLIAANGDGLKTSNSDVSDKGNQRGVILLDGAKVDIYAAFDGMDASYDIEVDGESNVNIFTGTYSEYSGEKAEAGTDFYLVIPTANYSEKTDFYAYYYNEAGDNNGVFKKGTFFSKVSGGNTTYYGLQLTAPSSYKSVRFLTVETGVTPTLDGASAISKGGTINTSSNAVLLSFSGDSIEENWVNLTVSSGGKTTTESAKGMKADNEIVINGGTICITAADDAIHANGEAELENGEDSLGDVTINGGTIVISTDDDGVHADGELTVNSGIVQVLKSYEGYEGATITINGGSSFIYASDDAVNAADGSGTAMGGGMGGKGGFGGQSSTSSTCNLYVNGGYLEVKTPSGDTDAIDCNGSFYQSGGYVIVKGGATSGSVCGSVDVDGSVQITGGAIVAVGGICEVPENSVNAYVSQGTSMAAGDYVLADANGNGVLSFTLDGTYSSVWIAADSLEKGTKYTLTRGTTQVLSWTQESGTQGYSGGGGMGGGPGRW